VHTDEQSCLVIYSLLSQFWSYSSVFNLISMVVYDMATFLTMLVSRTYLCFGIPTNSGLCRQRVDSLSLHLDYKEADSRFSRPVQNRSRGQFIRTLTFRLQSKALKVYPMMALSTTWKIGVLLLL